MIFSKLSFGLSLSLSSFDILISDISSSDSESKIFLEDFLLRYCFLFEIDLTLSSVLSVSSDSELSDSITNLLLPDRFNDLLLVFLVLLDFLTTLRCS